MSVESDFLLAIEELKKDAVYWAEKGNSVAVEKYRRILKSMAEYYNTNVDKEKDSKKDVIDLLTAILRIYGFNNQCIRELMTWDLNIVKFEVAKLWLNKKPVHLQQFRFNYIETVSIISRQTASYAGCLFYLAMSFKYKEFLPYFTESVKSLKELYAELSKLPLLYENIDDLFYEKLKREYEATINLDTLQSYSQKQVYERFIEKANLFFDVYIDYSECLIFDEETDKNVSVRVKTGYAPESYVYEDGKRITVN